MQSKGSLLASTLAALILTSPLSGQVLRGQITDAVTHAPIPGVLLTLIAADGAVPLTATTDSLGGFRLAPPSPGTYRLRAERVGYRPAASAPIPLQSGRSATFDMRLPPQIVRLDTVTARAQPQRRHAVMLSEFYRRMDQGAHGSFVRAEDIERARPLRLTQILASRIPGIRTLPARGGGFHLVTRGDCSPTVYLDGVRVPLMGQNIDDLVHPIEVEGVEVYRSISEAPPLYQGMNAGCSAILIWTRIELP